MHGEILAMLSVAVLNYTITVRLIDLTLTLILQKLILTLTLTSTMQHCSNRSSVRVIVLVSVICCNLGLLHGGLPKCLIHLLVNQK